MNIILIGVLFMGAFAAQYFLTFLQMRGFTKAYKKTRQQGYRAAIGKFSGAFHAGAIVMFGIDKNGKIMNGTAMQGVTVFARFKDYNHFNGVNIDTITDNIPENLRVSYSIRKAIADAELNYKTIMRGEEVPIPPSPLKKAGNVLVNSSKKITGLLSLNKTAN